MSADLALPVLAPREDRLVRALAGQIDGDVRAAAHDRLLYATDASIYQVPPVAVVIPRSREDVVRTVRFCAEHGLPVLARGGGTSLAGQWVNTAVVIDFSRHLRGVVAIDAPNRRARVEPGLVLDDLNRALAAHGLMFGPDVATSTHATIGGMIGNNSAGAHSILYGRTVEHVAALDVLTAAGDRLRLERGAATRDERVGRLTRAVADAVLGCAAEIRKRFPRTRRRVDGYNLDLLLDQIEASPPGCFDAVNLAHLVCGAEGTLAIVEEATVTLVEAPRAKGLGIVAFENVDAALRAVEVVLASAPAAVELIDDVIIALAERNLEYRRYVERLPGQSGARPGAVLYVEYFADDPGSIEARCADLEARFGTDRVRRRLEPAAMAEAWKLRQAGEPLLHGQPGPRKGITFIEDMAVEPAHLPEFIRRLRAIIEGHGTTASYYAHASVGCLHVRPRVDLLDPGDERLVTTMMKEVTDLVMEYGGALSGEHGDGRLRSHMLDRFYGAEICDAFGAVRRAFDPAGRLNPGNITAGPPMMEQLRVRPGPDPVRVPEVRTFYRYEREHGFSGAVEMCNGAGVCRRTTGGTMCPSYRATRDERHSTRGRGNALRLAITGQVASSGGGAAWNDAETMRTLDLCLSCKACKSECPSNVDVSKLKAEYLAQGYARAARVPLPARVFGRVRGLNRLGAIAPGVAAAVANFPPLRAAANRGLGLDPRRSLPPVGPSLLRWMRRRPAVADPGGPLVLLLADCFTTWSEPAVGRAAVRGLEALGYRVDVADVGCCGRPLLSTGQLDAAITVCGRTARTLADRLDETGAVGVVGCEPSCVSAIADDWLDLDLGVDRARRRDLAERTALVEEWIERGWSDHPRPLELSPGPEHVLLHGHCHQKALWGEHATAALLARLPGCRVTTLDAGCCGMAGAFGYTRDHFDLSMQIGELALFPALCADPAAVVAAPGTSCRHQVRDALGRRSHHPVELIAGAIARGEPGAGDTR